MSGGQTNFFEISREYLSTYPQRGLTVIVSDFLDESDCVRPLQYMADFGHELLLIQLWTKEDREPSGAGEIELIDAESGGLLRISLDDGARAAYTEAFDRHAGHLRNVALRNGGRYTGLSTEMPVEDALFGPLAIIERAG